MGRIRFPPAWSKNIRESLKLEHVHMSTTTEFSHEAQNIYVSFDHASRPMNESACTYSCQTANVQVRLLSQPAPFHSFIKSFGIHQHTTKFSAALSLVTVWCFTLVPFHPKRREYPCSTNARKRRMLVWHRPCRPFLISHDTLP